MYLSDIEILGFKSFAQKTHIKFTTGMTAIVGPNGCGKTNVVDALRWVLGEQKASTLRSDKMYDVIFNGTKHRRPLGLAEVSLIIENNRKILPTEYAHVKVTRRLFRSGESQYLLNGVECRLRDINDLFMDTGMGPDAYSVIELKMIETILSNKADDRRRLFEEAAGVTKYKARRKEAERKLEAVQGDLTRIQDIVSEVQKTVRSLSRQAAKAKVAAELKRHYDRVEIMILLLEYAALNQQIAPLQTTLAAERERKEKLEADVHKQEQALAECEHQHSAVQVKLEEAEHAYNHASTQVANASRELAVSTERKASLERDCERLRREALEIARTLETLAVRSSEVELQRETIAAELAATEAAYHQAKAASDAAHERVQAARQTVQQANAAMMDAMNRINAVRAEAERTIASINALKRRIDDNQQAALKHSEKLAHAEQDYNAACSRLVEFEKAIEASLAELKAAQERQSVLQAKLDEAKHSRSALQAELSRKMASLDFLQELMNAAESTQFLLETPLWKPRERSTLAETIRVDARLRVALESALHDAAQFIVVETVKEALAGAQALQQAGKGKATFICLEHVPAIEAPSGTIVQQLPGVLGWASELVRPNTTEYGNNDHLKFALRGLLGSTLIIESTDEARQAAFAAVRAGQADAAVTLDGELVSKYGIMRAGGATASEGASIGRREQREQLQHDIGILRAQADALDDEIAIASEELRAINLHRLAEILRHAETAKSKHEQRIAQCEFQRQSWHERVESCRREIELLTAEMHALEHEASLHAAQINDRSGLAELPALEAAKQQAEQALREAQETLLRTEEEWASAAESTRQLELDVVHLRNDERSMSAELNRLEREIETLEHRHNEREQEVQDVEHDIQGIAARFGELSATFDTLQQTATEALAARNSIAQEQSELRKTMQAHSEELRSARRTYEASTASFHEVELALSNLINRAESYRQRALEEFGFDIDSPPMHIINPQPQDASQQDTRIGLTELFPAAESMMESSAETTAGTLAASTPSSFSPETDPYTLFTAHNIQALKQEAKALKAKLQSVGTVNPLAYEEYERESTRLEFLETQFNDLQESERTLKHTIQEINQTAQKQFYEIFERIRANFISIFTSLFNEGDEADLLLEEGDPLEAPIKIIAKPRGKRPSSIEMLSGGEKTLTAIALLFAIYLVKPSPFCILDEVDAPLDDANIDRYIRLIRRFSQTTQFIMITHNKRTMEAAETLYGVTMEEEGVSKIVSVKFTEAEAMTDMQEDKVGNTVFTQHTRSQQAAKRASMHTAG
jgi:chromosome segregation protein